MIQKNSPQKIEITQYFHHTIKYKYDTFKIIHYNIFLIPSR